MSRSNVSWCVQRSRFIKPVFIGDTIYGIRTILRKEPKYPGLGLMVCSYEVFKHTGELALYCEHLQTVKYRDAALARWDETRSGLAGFAVPEVAAGFRVQSSRPGAAIGATQTLVNFRFLAQSGLSLAPRPAVDLYRPGEAGLGNT